MTDLKSDYRAKAEQCRQMAGQVISPLEQEMWLQLAADWSTLASLRERYRTGRYGRLNYRCRCGSCRSFSDWLKVKNPNAPAVRREAEEDWGR